MDIVCGNYIDKGYLELESGEKHRYVYVELYTDDTPSSFDFTPEDVIGMPMITDVDDMRFLPGSILIIISTGDVYMCGFDGTFVQF